MIGNGTTKHTQNRAKFRVIVFSEKGVVSSFKKRGNSLVLSGSKEESYMPEEEENSTRFFKEDIEIRFGVERGFAVITADEDIKERGRDLEVHKITKLYFVPGEEFGGVVRNEEDGAMFAEGYKGRRQAEITYIPHGFSIDISHYAVKGIYWKIKSQIDDFLDSVRKEGIMSKTTEVYGIERSVSIRGAEVGKKDSLKIFFLNKEGEVLYRGPVKLPFYYPDVIRFEVDLPTHRDFKIYFGDDVYGGKQRHAVYFDLGSFWYYDYLEAEEAQGKYVETLTKEHGCQGNFPLVERRDVDYMIELAKNRKNNLWPYRTEEFVFDRNSKIFTTGSKIPHLVLVDGSRELHILGKRFVGYFDRSTGNKRIYTRENSNIVFYDVGHEEVDRDSVFKRVSSIEIIPRYAGANTILVSGENVEVLHRAMVSEDPLLEIGSFLHIEDEGKIETKENEEDREVEM